MSATEAARQRLDGLRKQQASYREKLQQQEAELRRLQNDMYQNRTVVEVTMPGEIKKAYGEYLEILFVSSPSDPPTHPSNDRVLILHQTSVKNPPSLAKTPKRTPLFSKKTSNPTITTHSIPLSLTPPPPAQAPSLAFSPSLQPSSLPSGTPFSAP